MDFIQKLKAQIEFSGKVYEKDSRTHLNLNIDGSVDLPGNLDKLVAGGVNAVAPSTKPDQSGDRAMAGDQGATGEQSASKPEDLIRQVEEGAKHLAESAIDKAKDAAGNLLGGLFHG